MAKQEHDTEAIATYEQDLARYLQERIKPGLNSGAIPLLARSIAKDIAHREHPNGGADDAGEDANDGDAPAEQSARAAEEDSAEEHDQDDAGAGDEDDAGAEDEDDAGAGDEDNGAAPDFEADMHELQAELGEDWILRFSVKGDDGWLTAEKEDGSQRVEAPTADVIAEAVELLNERGGRSA